MLICYVLCTVAACLMPVDWLSQLCTTICLCMSWALLLCTVTFVAVSMLIIILFLWTHKCFKYSAFTCTWPTSDYAVCCRMFCPMSTFASHIVCSILPCTVSIAALCHGHCFICCMLWNIMCCEHCHVVPYGHFCFIYCILRGRIKGFNSSITTILFEVGSYRTVVG